jgi:acetyl esterase/lipase
LIGLTLFLPLAATVNFAAQESLPYEQKMDVVFGEIHGTGLLMDIFVPKGKPNGLGVVDVVSGAWHSDRGKIREHAMAQMYTVLCGHGYTVFAVRPGSITRYTASEMAQNIRTGIRYAKEHAAEYGIDPARLGLTGASAGGHLALLVAVTPEDGQPGAKNPLARHDTRVKAVSVFFPPTDFLDWNGQPAPTEIVGRLLFVGGPAGHTEDEVKERARAASPALLVKPTSVPFLIFHGDADPLVPLQQSKEMVEAIKAAGGSAELIIKKGGGHPWFTIFEEVEVMAKWFDEHLSDARASPATEKK